MKPSVGRIVHFVNEAGGHESAMITGVEGTEATGYTCNLYVWTHGGNTYKQTGVKQNEAGGLLSWHWPERGGA